MHIASRHPGTVQYALEWYHPEVRQEVEAFVSRLMDEIEEATDVRFTSVYWGITDDDKGTALLFNIEQHRGMP